MTLKCLKYWPPSAKEWGLCPGFDLLNLTTDDIKQIKGQGCSLVPKPERYTNDHSWRISLTDAEATIIRKFSEQQMLAYFITKILYYRHLSHLKDGNSELSSFAVKNAAFNYFTMASKVYRNANSDLFLNGDKKETIKKTTKSKTSTSDMH